MPKLLPQGVHKMTLEETHALFVELAPWPDHRDDLWATFAHYIGLLAAALPDTVLIIDGSFTMWDSTNPPADIDFVAIVNFEKWAELPAETRLELQRRRVTEGVLDAHFLPSWDVSGQSVWIEHFQKVTDQDGVIVPGLQKGVIEVRLHGSMNDSLRRGSDSM